MARPIMIQGTMSSAGKSLICAGLCRIFKQDGFRVAPLKARIWRRTALSRTRGWRWGRAQAMQALAAGIKPSVLMNPILLQPSSDASSRVIVQGRSEGTMSAADYFNFKRQLRSVVMESYRSLALQYEIIVLEGAGSPPAEINLKDDDIVNMGMAEMADAPVLLVGDIDRGGVFAAIYGTVALLEESERRRIRGIIINKFRGDAEILRPGLAMLEDLIDLPVLGVVPYLHQDCVDESSLSERQLGDQQYDALASALRKA